MSIPKQEPSLAEKDFIHEGYSKHPLPMWLWLFLATATLGLLWGIANWYSDKINLIFKESPFLQVTNRDLSLFLWQNPEFMRINVKEKGNYLPGFKYLDKVTIDVAYADQYAVAPPELLFRFHTWDRLLKNEFTEGSIQLQNFRNFLSYAEEWHPNYWPEAPRKYVELIKTLPESTIEDLSTLSNRELPLEVRIAFQGWKNYFIDGEAINTFSVTYSQLNEFLASHPNYARNYWQNIVTNYLKNVVDEEKVPSDELASFLRVALFNYISNKKGT
jgi:hypothetical protein